MTSLPPPDITTDHAAAEFLAAALPHVPFDGWGQATFNAALADSGLAPGLAVALFPRGGIDLAVAYHRQGDRRMLDELARADLGSMRFRDRIAAAVRLRLTVADPELVRRGTTLFALPHHAAEGAGLIWGTADKIWTALGDTSTDANWYSKRATLSAVYTATVVYWLGDTSDDHAATWEFLNRRIDNVMQVEKLKSNLRANPVTRALLAGPKWLAGHIRAPGMTAPDLPGHTADPR